MGTWANTIRNLITANIITGRKNKAADLRVVYSGIADAVQFLEGLQRGAAILNGVGAPDAALGLNGDAYIDTAVSDMFLKVNGAWTLRLVLRGQNGKSSYQSWLDAGNTGSEAAFVLSLRGQNGKSAYQSWLAAGNTGTEADFAGQLKGSKGDNGKSAYQLWTDAGNVGTLSEFLTSLAGRDGSRITSSEDAPALGGAAGDTHIQVLSPERFRLHYYGSAWAVLYTTPVGATVADGTVTNEKMASDVKVGSLAVARAGFPQDSATQGSLTSVDKFLLWLVNSVSALSGRIKTLEDRPATSGSTTAGVSTFNNRNGAVTLLASDVLAVLGNGTNTTASLDGTTGKVRIDATVSSSGPTTGAGLPSQDNSTVGKYLKSTGAAGAEQWAVVPASGHIIKDAAGATITQPTIIVRNGLRIVEDATAGTMAFEADPAGVPAAESNQAGIVLNFSNTYQIRSAAAGNITLSDFQSVAIGRKIRLELNPTGASDALLIGGVQVVGDVPNFQSTVKISPTASSGANQNCTFYDAGGPFISGIRNVLTIECIGTNRFSFTIDPQV